MDKRKFAERLSELLTERGMKPAHLARELGVTRAVIGRYVVESDIYDIISKTPASPSGEVYFTDALGMLAKQGRLVGCRFDGKRYDAGNKLEFLQANVEYALRDKALSDPFREYILSLAEKLR